MKQEKVSRNDVQQWGAVVISHGSGESTWVQNVDEAITALQARLAIPVAAGFLELVEGRSIPEAICGLEQQGVSDLVVIPLFISSGSTHVAEIKQSLGLYEATDLPLPDACGLPPVTTNMRLHWRAPMDTDPPLVVQMLREQVESLSRCKQQEAVLLVAHGSSYPAYAQRWRDGLERLAQLLRLEGYAAVEGALLLPDETDVAITRLRKVEASGRLLVIPLFLSEGYFTRRVIPQRLTNHDYHYEGRALLPHPLIGQWMEREIRGAMNGETGIAGRLRQTEQLE